MNEQDLDRLIKKYLSGKCTQEEKDLVEKWYEDFDERSLTPLNTNADTGWQKIQMVIKRKPLEILRNYNGSFSIVKLAVAAVLLTVVSLTGVYILTDKKTQSDASIAVLNDALPGKDRATLITDDGKKIILDDLAVGDINNQVKKTDSGRIAYTGTSEKLNAANTLIVPRGGQYRLILSDGTKVWLNADSRLTYPVAFGKAERYVMLQGEAYFEVAHDTKRPFTVKANNTETIVLGTHFNINAYTDNNFVTTTLLEGLVKFKTYNDEHLLHPNEQAISKGTSLEIKNLGEYAQDVVGWKDGVFKLTNAPVDDIMRQLSRWYNVAVEYKGRVPQGHISGDISRSIPLSDALEILKQSGVHAKIEQNKIIVTE